SGRDRGIRRTDVGDASRSGVRAIGTPELIAGSRQEVGEPTGIHEMCGKRAGRTDYNIANENRASGRAIGFPKLVSRSSVIPAEVHRAASIERNRRVRV